jgi:hypothetical protein
MDEMNKFHMNNEKQIIRTDREMLIQGDTINLPANDPNQDGNQQAPTA